MRKGATGRNTGSARHMPGCKSCQRLSHGGCISFNFPLLPYSAPGTRSCLFAGFTKALLFTSILAVTTTDQTKVIFTCNGAEKSEVCSIPLGTRRRGEPCARVNKLGEEATEFEK